MSNLLLEYEDMPIGGLFPEIFPAAPVVRQELRPYQVDCVESVFAAVDEGLRRLLYMQATGCGKTTTFAEIIRRMYCPVSMRPALVVAHREELLTQAQRRIAEHTRLRVGIERADQRAPRSSQVVVASVQTIGRAGTDRLQWLADIGPVVTIVDEAHHCTPRSGYDIVFDRFGGYDGRTIVIGCTATPKRYDRRALTGDHGAMFEREVSRYDIRRAIQEGYLCEIRGYRIVTNIDMSTVRKTAGDYNLKDLDRVVNTEARTRKAIEAWQKSCPDRKTIAFCVSVEHAHNVAKAFRDIGITAEAVDGSMDPELRRAILRRLSTGETQVVTNMNVLTEGFDEPSISCVLMLRPTQSWALFCQMVGRGTRLYPGKKDLVVIDVVDSTTNHNLASVPAILDLPADLDLKGKSLESAAKMLDDLGEKIEQFRDAPGLSFDDLEVLLKEVDLLVESETPHEIAEYTAYPWMRDPKGGFFLDCGREGIARIRQSEKTGKWCLRLAKASGEVVSDTPSYADELQEAIARADYWIERTWPSILVMRRGKWCRKPATDKQLSLLRKFRYSQAFLATLSAGQAGQLITAKLGKRKLEKANASASA